MRILHLVHQYLPEYVGGTELYTQALASGLAEDGHREAVFYRCSREGRGCEARMDGPLRVFSAWDGEVTPARRFLASFHAPALERAFEQTLADFRPDLIHVQHLMGLPLGLVRLIQRRGIPYVMTLHDYWGICANAQLVTNYDQTICAGPRVYLNCARCALARAGHANVWLAIPALVPLLAWRNARLRHILAEACAVITPSQFVCDWYAAHGVAAGTCRAISLGVERPPSLLRRRPSETLRFVYVGGISWQKGVHVILEAFREMDVYLASGAPEVELWIVGDEAFDPAYTRRLRSLATPRVRFCGRLDRAGVWDVLAQADALLVPSLWYESFGLVVREAFVAGIPVILSDLGALAEAVRDGVDGLRVPPGDVALWRDAMARFVRDPALRATLRGNSPVPLTLAEHRARIVAVYENVTKFVIRNS